jgi:hypothetical protein
VLQHTLLTAKDGGSGAGRTDDGVPVIRQKSGYGFRVTSSDQILPAMAGFAVP